MGLLSRLAASKVRYCACGRALTRSGTCPACTARAKRDDSVSRRAGHGGAMPHPCREPGCTGTVRSGVCSAPDCTVGYRR